MLLGLVAAAGAIQNETQSVMSVSPVRLGLEHRPQVRLGGRFATGPEDFGQAQPGVGIVRPAAENRTDHRFGAPNVALVPAIESGVKLGRVATLLEWRDC